MDIRGILRFLTDLKKNNNRDWFQKNKERYLDARNSFDDFLEALHKELLRFDTSLEDVVAGGLYQPNPKNLAKVRQEIDYAPEKLLRILKDRKFRAAFKGFDDFDRVKTAPKGYAKDHPQIDLLKNKSFIVSHNFSDNEAASPAFVKTAAAACRLIKPLNDYLNEAVS
jgi:uncharacterized protein (DUF2461 family)